MTDTSTITTKPRGGIAKASFSGIYFAICENITPSIVAYMCAHFPLLTEAVWFEIVAFTLAGIGGMLVAATPQHFVQWVTTGIIFFRQAWTTWRKAASEPLPPQ